MLQPTETEKTELVSAIFGQALAQHANTFKFDAYFRRYVSVVCPASSGDAVIELDTSLLRSHGDVIKYVQFLTKDPALTLDAFVAANASQKSIAVSVREKQHISRVIVEVLFAIDCMAQDYYSPTRQGFSLQQIKWEGNTSFLAFIESSFKAAASGQDGHQPLNKTHIKSLKGWKLVKRYGIKIRGTNNLLEHLDFDTNSMTLKVFHQVSFLRAHLTKTKEQPLDLSFEESIKQGSLPPRLLLETLLTFHDVLFPVASIREKKSRSLLKQLITKHDFDGEAEWIEFVRPTPEDITVFRYWGHRLAALHEIVKRPPPANAMVSWFERHTSERNALTVAIVGLFLSVLFGLLSFIVGLLQLILAWGLIRIRPRVSTLGLII